MVKPVIAFDLDDVLVDSTAFWRTEINKRTGANLQPEHFMVPGQYSGYYSRIWKEYKIDRLFSIDDIDKQMAMDQSELKPFQGAAGVLNKLAKKYDLVAVTARNSDQKSETQRWLGKAYPGIFKKSVFGNGSKGLAIKNKGDLCKELGAQWLVDDNPGHCNDALEKGVTALLFGDYGWNQPEIVEQNMVRVKDWAAVLEYFEHQGASKTD